MQQRRFNLYVILAAIAFSGILLSQAYWVFNGQLLQREQFDHRVEIVLRTVLNRLLEYHIGQKLRCLEAGEPCVMLEQSFELAIPATLIDSIVKEEFSGLGIDNHYYYAVFSRPTKQFSAGRYLGFEDQIINSKYHQSLKSLFFSGDYVLAAVFPKLQNQTFASFTLVVLLSALFLLTLFFSFLSTVSLVRRQKRLSRVKADFLNNMTHELKTPIASIGLAAEMLSKPVVASAPEKVTRYAAVVKDESNRLQTLVDHVLMSAMLEESKVRLNKQKINLSELVENVLNKFRYRIDDQSGNLEVSLQPEIPPVYLDKLHITNVLSNLLDNAIKYSRGAPDIRVNLRCINNWIVLSVSDKGIGIRSEEKDLIFKNLYRSHTGNQHDVKGFGIGLFYVKKIVELHGGKVTVESESGVGSVFEVHLPALAKT
jgi:two-component system phosphate regulon sensor histidine kinase PhoR